jgi:hypothetical protein
MQRKCALWLLMLMVVAFMTSVSGQAAQVSGNLDIFGRLVISTVGTDQIIRWLPPLGGGTGPFSVNNTSTGAFAPLGGTGGTAINLNTASQPVGTPISLGNFLTFAGAPNLSIELTELVPGATLGPLTMTDSVTGVFIGMSVFANAHDSLTGASTKYMGIFATQVSGTTTAKLLMSLAGGGLIEKPYTASFAPFESGTGGGAPEPSTALLILTGTALLAFGKLRMRPRTRI